MKVNSNRKIVVIILITTKKILNTLDTPIIITLTLIN